MKHVTNDQLFILWFLFLLLTTSGCATVIAKYDNTAYRQSTSLKVDALALMDKATNSYTSQAIAIDALKININKAHEYARGRPKNKIISKQWLLLKDPKRHLLGGFLIRWKKKETLSTPFIREAKGNIALAFDQIIGLESGLIKQKNNQ
ncbi:MAG: hypothetical protein KAH03_00015 [Cocleimonas sp.]|nr:hypothetical protein [Cocleimonas sp.]